MERELSPVVIRCHHSLISIASMSLDVLVLHSSHFLARFFPCPCAVHPHSFNPSVHRCLITLVAHNLTYPHHRSPPSLLPSSLSSWSCSIFPTLPSDCLPTILYFPFVPLCAPLSSPRSSLHSLVIAPPPFLDTVRPTANTSSGTKRAQTSTTFSTQSRRAWHHTGQRVSSVSAESSA